MPHFIRNKGLPFFLFFLILYFPPVFVRAETSDAPPQGGELFSALPGAWMLAAAILLAVVAVSIIANILQYRQKNRLEDEIAGYRQIAREAVEQQKAIKDIFDHLNDHVFFHDMEGNFYEVSASVQRDADYTESELTRMNIKDLVPEPFTSQVDDYLERVRRNGYDRGYLRVANKAGEEMILEYNNTVIYDQKGTPVGVRGISRNITQQISTRKALEKSEKKYRTILETIEDGYYEVDLRGTYKFLNNSALRILGYRWEELAGKSYKTLIAEDDVGQVFETFNYVYHTGRPVKAFHWRSICKDGSTCYLETSVSLLFDEQGKAAGFQGIIRDISDRIKARNRQKELEGQLQQAQKMESIGTLAGGIAHDFNNILFPMTGYTELAMQDLPPESTAYQNLKKVMKSAERAKALVQQILNFSRQSSNESTDPVYIQPVLKETVKLLKNTIPSSIDIQANIDEDTGKVTINLAQMHQVIMNLCTNAYQAMEILEAGRISVDLQQMEITEETSPDHHHLTPGAYACITVSDTGSGISPEIKEKIFEPYFTTKSQEKGTGLGLSVSYGIIKNAGGIITAESTPGEGSCFNVYIPIAGESADVIEPGIYQSALPTGTEQVLLVDDEQQIVEIEKQILESLGYHVTARTDSAEAEELFCSQPDRFDIMVTDQTMPSKTGLELIRTVRQIRPDLPVILCTGYSERVDREKMKASGVEALLLKPISKKDLAITVNRVLHKAKV